MKSLTPSSCNLSSIDYPDTTLHHSLPHPPEFPWIGNPDSLSEATIHQFTFAAFTTAQSQSPWLPHSSHTRHPPLDTHSQASTVATAAAAAAAPAVHNHQYSQQHIFRPQGDFVLFDSPTASETGQRPKSQPKLSVEFNGNSPFAQATTSSLYNCTEPRTQKRNRPPVPLFTNNSTGKLYQSLHQETAKMEGTVDHDIQACIFSHLISDFRLFDALTGAGSIPGLDAIDSAWNETAPSFTPVNVSSAASTTRTVSPKDLVLSAPASSALTNLTSPSVQVSPFDICESYNTSPLFPSDDNVPINPGSYSLFPENLSESSDALQRSVSFQSLEDSSSNESPSLLNLNGNQRTSMDVSPHISGAPVRHSSVSGVKGRRRNKPLAPIVYDPNDKTAIKRARNTESARQSRQRRYEWEEKMREQLADREAEIEELKRNGDRWKQIALSLGYTESM